MNIVIVSLRTGWATPCWRCRRSGTCGGILPDEPLTVAARPSIAPLFRAVPGVDRIIVLEPGKESSQIEATIGILLPNSFRSAWILKRAGVKERWGYRQPISGGRC